MEIPRCEKRCARSSLLVVDGLSLRCLRNFFMMSFASDLILWKDFLCSVDSASRAWPSRAVNAMMACVSTPPLLELEVVLAAEDEVSLPESDDVSEATPMGPVTR